MHTSTVTTDVPAPRTHDRASDELDRLTTDLALRVRAGALPEREARMAVFEAVFRTGIIPSETLRYCHRHDVARFLHDDMVEAAVDFYTRKLLDLPSADGATGDSTGRNGTKFFDLEVFADGASAAGSIRQALGDYTLMHRTLLRTVRSARRVGQIVSTDLLEGTVDDEGRLAGLLHELPVVPDPATDVVDAGRSAQLEQLYETHVSAAARQRGVLRTQIDAGAIREAFDLPELDRPLDPDARARMLGWVEEDADLALRSVVGLLAPTDERRAVLLGRLWAAFDRDRLSTLADHEYGARIADLLVRDALADRARPGRPAVSRTRVAVKQAVAGCGVDAAWVAELTAVFLEHEHEARSAWDPDRGTGETTRDAARYLAALTTAAALPGAPLGATPLAVRRALADLVAAARTGGQKRSLVA
ncbi:hypothetical protein G8C93_06030 [Cellulosimicrobium cellulans]|uniref:hypothetical protein n=1 Tax=Cellulosimicrobium cellulans TaxID=1710 RepID=UPI001883CF40|nr:hypothetical protein [Cellulosimicrobium cellulans]MBE9925449.1 hypothetical protein [Cellulosimicrobium cellulans]